MTTVLITTDTELSASRQRGGMRTRANFDSSILGRTPAGDFGIGWQMDRLEQHGLTGAFFVDPLPALVLGHQVIADIVGPIVARGHDVQLHLHTEWLEWAPQSPVGGRRGRNLAEFSGDDQRVLLDLARELLVAAGAPSPIAFRAGNYGANDTTLAVLAELGFRYDTSFNGDYAGRGCGIGLSPTCHLPVHRHGLIELPVSGLHDRPGRLRPAQVCAMSGWEMGAALRHAADTDAPAFTIVNHSFEMLSRDRQRPNRQVMRRMEALCRAVAADPRLSTARYADLDPATLVVGHRPTLGPSRTRTWARQLEQAIGTWRYERRLRPQ